MVWHFSAVAVVVVVVVVVVDKPFVSSLLDQEVAKRSRVQLQLTPILHEYRPF